MAWPAAAAAATFTFGSQKFLAQLLSGAARCGAAPERIIYGLTNLCLNFNRKRKKRTSGKVAKPER